MFEIFHGLYLIIRTAFLRKSNETIQLFRLSSNTLEKSSSNGIKIDIPKYINRSSTDILKVNIINFVCNCVSLVCQVLEYPSNKLKI